MSDAPLTKDPRDVEFQAIGALIRAGQESGLLAELIWSFGMDRAGGSSVPEAVEYALCWRKWIDASKNPNREAEMSDSHSAEQSVDERFLRMPLEVLTTPREGALCYLNRYWLVTDADEALFYKHYTSPQCNADKRIVERLLKRPGTKVVFVPVAYVRHNCSDYV